MKYWQKQQISKVLYQSCGHIQFCWCRKPRRGLHPAPKPTRWDARCPSAGRTDSVSRGNEQGANEPPRSSGPGTGGTSPDCLSPRQHPQHPLTHLTGHLLDPCWFVREAGQALGNEIKMITCCILTLLFLFNLSAHNSLPVLLQHLCGIINTLSYSEH